MQDATSAAYTISENFRCLENLRRTSSELYLTYCGWERNEPLQKYASAPRKNHVLHFVLEGKGVFTTSGRKWELSKGDIFYIPPGTEAEYTADQEEPWTYAWIGYNGVRADECSALSGFSAEEPVRPTGMIDEVYTQIDGILQTQTSQISSELRRVSLLFELFSILVRENEQLAESGKKSQEEPDFVKLAMTYISQNFDKNIRIHELALHLGVSRSYLSSCFKKSVGCSPQSYILSIRMEHAASLLRTTTLPVNIISGAVGYQDQLAFSKIFKQVYGISPRDYRKSGQEIRIYSKKGDFVNSDL